jgi:hypothetical protein
MSPQTVLSKKAGNQPLPLTEGELERQRDGTAYGEVVQENQGMAPNRDLQVPKEAYRQPASTAPTPVLVRASSLWSASPPAHVWSTSPPHVVLTAQPLLPAAAGKRHP